MVAGVLDAIPIHVYPPSSTQVARLPRSKLRRAIDQLLEYLPALKEVARPQLENWAKGAAVLRRFKWPSNDAQNLVAKWIAGDHMKPDAAAEKWVKANMAVVNKWLGK